MPNIGKAIISTHCHDDLGMAVANSLAGVEAGARQVECTINGIGERAGNAALEEIVMALEDPPRLFRADHRNQDRAALSRQPDGLDDHRPARAAEQGDRRPQRLRPRSGNSPGRHAQGAHRLTRSCGPRTSACREPSWSWASTAAGTPCATASTEMGYNLSDEQLEMLFNDFKTLADKKKEVYDEDLAILVEKHMEDVPAPWQLLSLHTTAGTSVLPTATVRSAAPTARSSRTRRSATARSTPSSRPSSGSPACTPTCTSSSSAA